ncbi:MAG: aspartate-semialdehyde dehydrogenase [Bacteroidales bacterium]|nr:aspartate-semialdehyde dehydrogenase [Bacteroidales bacterium]
MKIAVIGATGLVGQKMLQVLAERNLPVDELIVAASERSIGKKTTFKGKGYTLISVEEAIEKRPDIAIFSAGADASLKYAPLFAEKGTYVVDNSSAWRKKEGIPLVVPEINANDITVDTHIIANPNCSTIQLVMALAPLHRKYGIKRIVVSTYQSVSGSGLKGLNQLHCEQRGEKADNPAYPHQIHENIIPHGGNFLDDGNTTEEEKLIFETNKILHSKIAVSATVARVPVYGGHSESVNVEFLQPYDLQEIRTILENTPGVIVADDPSKNLYPTPIMAYDRDEVFVGRMRRDNSIENGFNFWVVSDNIRKGAATNAVEIAQYLIKKILI